MNPELSVIIPTHKRASIVKRCIEHLEKQTIADQIEVIVVSDGHDEETTTLFANSSWHVPVEFMEIEKAHQGVARNRGVERARASTCLFLGDDFFLEPDGCERHLDASSKFQVPSSRIAVLGFSTWDPSLEITPVMRWLEKSGWQFGYPMIAPYAGKAIPEHIQHKFTYTSHISLPKEIAKKHAFREDVSLYGWEDIEWGMRLREAGVHVVYEPGARAYHHHPLTLQDSLKRMEILGESAVYMEKIVPGFDRLPRGWKLLAYKIAALLPTMAGQHRKAFMKGVSEVHKTV